MSLPASPALANDHAEGRRRKGVALDLLAIHRESVVRDAQRALLEILLRRGNATIDDVHPLIAIPDGVVPHCLGAVPGPLARLGIIRRAGFVETARPVAHARPVSLWELIDRPKAETWLATHPPIALPSPEQVDAAPINGGAA